MNKIATAPDIRVLAIGGSLRTRSLTRLALDIALEGAREVGATTKHINLRDYELVLSNGNEDEDAYPEDVFRLREEVHQAHAVLLGTPEYHGGYSGVLKNVIDLMGFRQFESKIIGLVGVGGGSLGAVNALNGLRVVGRSLHAWVVPEQVSIPEAWKKFDREGRLTDQSIEKRLRDLGRQVARFAFLHHSEMANEFLRAWEDAPLNPGG